MRQTIDRLAATIRQRRELIDQLKLSLDRETGQRGPIRLRQRRTGIMWKLAQIDRKVTESEKLLGQLQHVCRR